MPPEAPSQPGPTPAGRLASLAADTARLRDPSRQDPLWVRVLLTVTAVAVVLVLIVVPVINVFYQALANGVGAYVHALVSDPDTRHAIGLTLTVAPAAVAMNLVFGVAAAWALARFRFPGRVVLLSLIDLPFSVSPVVAGLVFVLLFGVQGLFGPLLRQHGLALVLTLGVLVSTAVAAIVARARWPRTPWPALLSAGAVALVLSLAAWAHFHRFPRDPGFDVLFATPGLILATAFVTFPFVARELLPVLEAVGPEEELAAVSLGATGWQMFTRITLPNIKWGLLYGVILCNARAMGEFGAVHVVGNAVAGRTETMPLRVERLVQGYKNPQAFALASLLTLLALVTLGVKTALERKGVPRSLGLPIEAVDNPPTPGPRPEESSR
jgi:sulfate/thiosulfate transport system permease protein